MKKIKEVFVSMLTLVMCFTLSGCGNKYASHYSAMMMVRSNTSNKASVSFDTFSGTYVMQLKNNGSDEVCISYDASLEEGNINVYYDFNDEKLNLFEVGTDDDVEGKTDPFTGNKTIYIIIESDGKCSDGEFSFVLEKTEK